MSAVIGAEISSSRSRISNAFGATLDCNQAEAEWYCLRTHLKHEHIAAAQLRHLPGLRVFNPQLRIERLTRRGPVRSTESLFANYIFARFVLESMVERVRYTPSVKGIVAFGERPAVIATSVIDELRSTLAENSDTVFTDWPMEGEEVEVLQGPFSGEHVTIARVLPAHQRVEVLMEMLGRSVPVEFSLSSLLFRRRNPADCVLGLAHSEPVLRSAH